jgi:IS1 family transposase
MARIMPVEKRNTILRLLVEGNSVRSVTRLMGTNIPTVLRQLTWAGDHCHRLMDERFRNLTLTHLECDETWTFVQKKQARLTMTERAERGDIGDIYLWIALDQETKCIPSYALGKRSGDMARRFMVDLASRLVRPTAHQSDDHAYRVGRIDPITQVSTDAWAGYPEAVDLAFGAYVKFGTISKEYRNADRKPGNYSPSQMIGTTRRPRRGMTEEEKSTICTSHVERTNLTIRTFMKRFSRLALGFSKKLENLEAAVNLHMAYYNFCWRPGAMRVTPAMASGVTQKLWSFADLMEGGR